MTQLLEQTWTVAVNDLLTWEEETDRLLPAGLTAELIADLEERGIVVDLVTGQAFDELTGLIIDLAEILPTCIEEDAALTAMFAPLPYPTDGDGEAIGEDFSTRPYLY